MNWPIRVGGEYASRMFPFSQFKRVTRVADGRVYFTRHFFQGAPSAFPGEENLSERIFCDMSLSRDLAEVAEVLQ